MQREIKFRAWDNFFKQMYYFDFENNIEVRSGHLWITHEEGAVSSKSPSVKIMQYTGSKDRDGKEIYEGDICQLFYFDYDDEKLGREIIYHNGAFGYNAQFIGFVSLAGNHNFEWVNGQSEHIKVIGNIYETPELLRHD